MNLRAAAVAVVTLCLGLVLFVAVTGPVRGLFGDVLIVILGIASFAAVGVGTPRVRIGGMFLLGVAAEGVQALHLVGPDSHWLLHLTIGSTPDPLDIVAYAVGAALGAVAERWWAPSGPIGSGA